jgi:hypothetical protein
LPARVEHYRSLGDGYDGPVPFDDLATDAGGGPIEGHLTIASFRWWTERFEAAGFERWVEVERRLYADLEPTGLTPFWNLYVFGIRGASPALADPLEPERSLAELGLRHPLLEVGQA